MSGRPVWLASVSRWNAWTGTPIYTAQWEGRDRSRMLDVLHAVLGEAGEPERERCFRMNLTMCLHRAVSDAELAVIPASWHAAPPVHMAGGPVEVLWSKGVEDTPSTKPCKRPGREPFSGTWLPIDCGRCGPCRARRAIEQEVARRYPDAYPEARM